MSLWTRGHTNRIGQLGAFCLSHGWVHCHYMKSAGAHDVVRRSLVTLPNRDFPSHASPVAVRCLPTGFMDVALYLSHRSILVSDRLERVGHHGAQDSISLIDRDARRGASAVRPNSA